ncbi:MAG TPA: VOC family protein [Thermomicrobiaceae bacterium]|nr:VOC family protein [Thermomicrobiaceae bacterium]
MAVNAQIDAARCHAAIRVRDLDTVVRFYRDTLGIPVQFTRGDPARPDAFFFPGVQLVRAGDQDIGDKGVFDHVGLAVSNLDAIVEGLAAAGIPLDVPLTDLSREFGTRVRLVFIRDPEGNRVELVQWG